MTAETCAKPLPAPPAIASARSVPPRVVIPSSKASFRKPKNAEKIGRWTEEEHLVFLDGLEKHGKQWKTIAGMIGTRTVVQVRTHAQKYFQKMERKNKPIALPKRKSLPTSLPSRKKPKTVLPKKPRISISLGSLSPAPERVPHIPLYSSSSLENLSTISPSGVAELEFSTSTDSFNIEDTQFYGEDPLEWLMENEQHLPESSLTDAPMFPDITDTGAIMGGVHLQPQSSTYDVMDSLPNLADPKVTVQSLFMED